MKLAAPRITVITLGVSHLEISKAFYQTTFGWKVSPASNDHITFFLTPGIALALYPRNLLAEDAQVSAAGNGFRGITLAHNVHTKAEVSQFLSRACHAGGTLKKEAQDVFWGGHSGYFADPDGHLWEVAWNPHFGWNEDGSAKLPE